MSNLSVRKHNGENVVTPGTADPGRLIRRLLGWDPFREMDPFLREEGGGLFSPPFDVKETRDAYEFRADLPGISENDVEITMTGNRLTIAGKREMEKEAKTDTYFATERMYGTFVRSFTMPDGIDPDHVQAAITNGVLTVAVPKTPEAQPKRISIMPTASKQKS